MTTKNLNNIMKTTKLNLSSMVLSKNTSEILKSCVGKLYRQLPMTFQKNLEQVKIDATKTENRAPIAVLQMQDRRSQRLNPLMIKQAIKTKTNNFYIKRSSNPVTAPYKNLLQMPPNRLCNVRRFGSSPSSSYGSLLHRCNDKHRSTRALHFQVPHSTPKATPNFNATFLHRNGVSLVIPARNQHISSHLGSLPQAITVSSNIQRDLMNVDNVLKSRLKPTFDTKLNSRTNVPTKLSKVRDHFPSTHILATRNEQSLAKSELNQQHKSFKTTTCVEQLETNDQEKTQSPSSTTVTLTTFSNHSAFTQATPPNKSDIGQVDQLPKEEIKILPSEPQVVAQESQIKTTAKESQIKTNDKKTIKPKKIVSKTNTFIIKDKSARLLRELENLYKPFKGNGKVAPSATYCMAKPSRCNRIHYLVQPK